MRRHRAHVPPPPIVSPAPAPGPSLGELVHLRSEKMARKLRQGVLWPEPDVRSDGKKRG